MDVMRRGFRREIEALDEVFRFLEDFCDAADVDDRACFTINLVVEEIFTNMVRHNSGGDEVIDLEIERTGSLLHLRLTDSGVERFDPAEVPRPSIEADIGDRRPGGLGLYLVQTMVDDVSYTYEPGTRQMRVSVTKRLES
jgi:anti-sigma regulatory factor (Ser/Thr protein kinase)